MAQLKIRFVNFDRSVALENYTRKHVGSLGFKRAWVITIVVGVIQLATWLVRNRQ